MIIRITTGLEASPEKVFEKLLEPQLFLEVAAPLISVKPVTPNQFPEKWEAGKKYVFRMYFLGFLPLGKHTIKLLDVDPDKLRLYSNEHGTMTNVWNHLITLKEDRGGNTVYTDEVELEAGIKTPFVWLFANWFYRHRQRKWRRIAKNL